MSGIELVKAKASSGPLPAYRANSSNLLGFKRPLAKPTAQAPSLDSSPPLRQAERTTPCSISSRACPFGGACHTCPATVQAKLTISQPDDKYEQEADRIADQVMRMPEPCPACGPREKEEEKVQPKSLTESITPLVQRQTEPEEEEEPTQTKSLAESFTPLVQRQVESDDDEEEPIQAKPLADSVTPLVQLQVEPEEEDEEEPVQAKQNPGQHSKAPSRLATSIQSLRSGGRPLSDSTRAFFEPRFGCDFSWVRVHADARAVETAQAINARAFTIGKDVIFGAGQFMPDSPSGRQLLAHELTHVVQRKADVLGKVDEIRRTPAQLANPRISKLCTIVIEELDSFWPSYKVLLKAVETARKIGGLEQFAAELRSRPHKVYNSYFIALLRGIRTRGSEEIFRIVMKELAQAGIFVPETEDILGKVNEICTIVIEELDSFWPSYKVLLKAVETARKIGGLEQFAAKLRSRPHKVHKTYFLALLRGIKSRGSKEIFRIVMKELAQAGIFVPETVEEYPLRFQIADYISGKIEDTKGILIGKPKDSIAWVLWGTLVETFYTIEEGFVDVLRIGKGAEEAARAYAFEKDVVDRWAGVVKGLCEDFLRITVIFPSTSVEHVAIQSSEEAVVTRLIQKSDEAIGAFVGEMERNTVKQGLNQAEKQGVELVKDAAQTTKNNVKSTLMGKSKGVSSRTYHTRGKKGSYKEGSRPSVEHIRGSKSLENEAVEAAIVERNKLSSVQKGKVTASVEGKATLSGWKSGSGAQENTEAVIKLSKEIGHDLQPNKLLDQGVPGRFNASHAEKQATIIAPDKAIAVSEIICDNCRRFFVALARYRGKSLIVAEPKTVWIFRPDGSIGVVPR